MNGSDPTTTRRDLLGGIATGAGAGVLTSLAGSRSASAQTDLATSSERRPNILLIGSRASIEPTSSHCGRPLPSLVRLAREGFSFENYRSDYPFRQPTWSEVFAGRWNADSEITQSPSRQQPDSLTQAFICQGYRTVLIGGSGGRDPRHQLDFEQMTTWSNGDLGQLARLVREHAETGSDYPMFMSVLQDACTAYFDGRLDRLLDSIAHSADLIIVVIPPLHGYRDRRSIDLRLPLIVWSQHRVAENYRSGVPMAPLDIAPTISGLASVPRPSGFVGIDYSAIATQAGSQSL